MWVLHKFLKNHSIYAGGNNKVCMGNQMSIWNLGSHIFISDYKLLTTATATINLLP